MPAPVVRVPAGVDELRPALAALRDELDLPTAFPVEVEAEAAEAAAAGPTIAATDDLTDVPFVTLDPEGSRDLDQAVHVEGGDGRGGCVVWYAIADVAAYVRPGGAIDAEARRRALTIYLPDGRIPLHPPVLSEGAVSLLPDQERQAIVWRFELDADGEPVEVSVRRASMRSRRQYSYDEVDALLATGRAPDALVALSTVGRLREQREIERGGVSLGTPEQRIAAVDGRYELSFRASLPIEGWNAQISLMTGMAAASLMATGGVGIVRTLPPAADADVAVLRRTARAVGVEWPADLPYADLIRSLDGRMPDQAALLVQATRLFRGAGYEAFGAAGTPATGPVVPAHAAVGAPYAHVTAPLRRLVDRFGTECALAAYENRPPEAWAVDALAGLPEAMADGRRREGAADGKAADIVEAAVLAGRIGDTLDAVVVRAEGRRLGLHLTEPAVTASLSLPSGEEHASSPARSSLGDEVRVRVVAADPHTARVDLELVAVTQQDDVPG